MKKLILCSLAVLMVPTFAWGAMPCNKTTEKCPTCYNYEFLSFGNGDRLYCLVSGHEQCAGGTYVLAYGSHRRYDTNNEKQLGFWYCRDAVGDADIWDNDDGHIASFRACSGGGFTRVHTADGYTYGSAGSIKTGYTFSTSESSFCRSKTEDVCVTSQNKIYQKGEFFISETCPSVASNCVSTKWICGPGDNKFHFVLTCEDGSITEPDKQCGETPTPTTPTTPTTPKKPKCEERYSGFPARIACCKHPASVTTWEPKGASPAEGHCECVDKSTKWTYVPGQYTGQCMPAGGCGSLSGDAKTCCETGGTWNETTNTCDCGEGRKWDTAKKQCVQDNSNVLSNCIYRFNGKVKCANGNSVTINEQRPLTVAELGGIMSCDQFNNLYQSNVGKLNEFFANYCGGGAIISIVTGPSAAEVESAKSTLSAFFSAAQSNASVWKDSEGKFNKARLASDLTAGVVLGSVGGVVSGVVIKKKQVQKGFEALHCAVGGQTIADWGDEFNVGLRR